MKLVGKIKKVHIIFLAVLIVYSFTLVNIAQAVTAGSAEPGSDENPLVAKDYVDSQVSELLAKEKVLNDTVADLKLTIESLKTQVAAGGGQSTGGNLFNVVELKAGQKVIAGAGAEIIVRAGKATAISSEAGGLADITADTTNDVAEDIRKNLMTGQEIPTNHLLVISRDDGRGLAAVSEKVWVLVKGPYQIK